MRREPKSVGKGVSPIKLVDGLLDEGDKVIFYIDRKVMIKEYEPVSVGIGTEIRVRKGESGQKAFLRANKFCSQNLASEVNKFLKIKKDGNNG